MRSRLDAFGDDRATKGAGQSNHAVDDCQVVGVIQHVADKALVDLQGCRRQMFEVAERRVACTEVVQGEVHADGLAGFHYGANLAQVFQAGGFQDLELQAPGLHVWMLCQQLAESRGETVLLQLPRADVYADRHCQPPGVPGAHLRQRGADHPFTDFNADGVIFGDR